MKQKISEQLLSNSEIHVDKLPSKRSKNTTYILNKKPRQYSPAQTIVLSLSNSSTHRGTTKWRDQIFKVQKRRCKGILYCSLCSFVSATNSHKKMCPNDYSTLKAVGQDCSFDIYILKQNIVDDYITMMAVTAGEHNHAKFPVE